MSVGDRRKPKEKGISRGKDMAAGEMRRTSFAFIRSGMVEARFSQKNVATELELLKMLQLLVSPPSVPYEE